MDNESPEAAIARLEARVEALEGMLSFALGAIAASWRQHPVAQQHVLREQASKHGAHFALHVFETPAVAPRPGTMAEGWKVPATWLEHGFPAGLATLA